MSTPRLTLNNTWFQVNSSDWSGTFNNLDTTRNLSKPTKTCKTNDLTTQILPPPNDVPIDTWFQLPSGSGNALNWDAYVIPTNTTPNTLLPPSPTTWDPVTDALNDDASTKKSKDKSVPNGFRAPQRNIDIEAELSRQNLYKTELCRSWVESAMCKYGTKCQFAHGKHELRPVIRHPKYKTEICKTFHTNGTCPYGKRCRFVHNPHELRTFGELNEAEVLENGGGDGFVGDITPEEVVTEEQRAIEEKIAQLRLGLLAPDPVFIPPSEPQVVQPKKTGSRLPFFQKLRKQKT